MIAPELKAKLERCLSFSDEADSDELYAPEAILEFPQSGERFEGVENFQEWRRQYPAQLASKIRRLDRWGDLVVAEIFIRYEGGPPMHGVSLLELNAQDKVVRERIYVTDGWEPPAWRAPWRSKALADAVTWD